MKCDICKERSRKVIIAFPSGYKYTCFECEIALGYTEGWLLDDETESLIKFHIKNQSNKEVK